MHNCNIVRRVRSFALTPPKCFCLSFTLSAAKFNITLIPHISISSRWQLIDCVDSRVIFCCCYFPSIFFFFSLFSLHLPRLRFGMAFQIEQFVCEMNVILQLKRFKVVIFSMVWMMEKVTESHSTLDFVQMFR